LVFITVIVRSSSSLMSEVFASLRCQNDGVLKKLVFVFKKGILLFNYNLLNNALVDFLTFFNGKLIV
jgi:hypothetical protein